MRTHIFLYTLLKYLEVKQSRSVDLNFFYELSEPDFKLSEKSLEHLFDVGITICRLEAESFLTDENKEILLNLLKQLKNIQTDLINDELNDFLNLYSFTTNDLEQINWRVFLGILICLEEWCTEVEYQDLTPEQRITIITENPAYIFHLF